MSERVAPQPPVRVGMIGCGNISGIYIKNSKVFKSFELVAVSDIDMDRAREKAAEHGTARAMTVEELLADSSIELVLNLTIPAAHGPVGLSALNAGKSYYTEKPLAVSREDGRALLALARERGLRVGGAPDTFLGAGIQTCRKLIDDGWIGTPVAATAFMLGHGPESWHPNPGFFYEPGAGPMFDMGPYYLTTLVTLLGPVRRVTGSARISFPERVVTNTQNFGARIPVTTPTHIAGVMDFAAGAVGTIITSFDVWSAQVPRIEIYGSEGTLSVPDPNTFGGPVLIRRAGASAWSEVPLAYGYAENSRGLGLADVASSIRSGRAQRASGELAYHVLDLMHAFHDASREGRHIELESSCDRPASLPMGLLHGMID